MSHYVNDFITNLLLVTRQTKQCEHECDIKFPQSLSKKVRPGAKQYEFDTRCAINPTPTYFSDSAIVPKNAVKPKVIKQN